MNKNVLMYTVRNDFHSEVIGHALKLRGNHIFKWTGDDYPASSTASISFDGREGKVLLKNSDAELSGDDVDVVWFRRRMLPDAPAVVDRRDKDFSVSELRAANCANLHFFEKSFWINSSYSASLCDLKPVQLRMAAAAGLSVPATLISNDPYEIKRFIGSVKSCIYKPLNGGVWSENGRVLNAYTAKVNAEFLPSHEMLQSTPGIFQERIAKSFEVRAQFFGNFYGAIRIESLNLKDGDLDWRIDQNSISSCAPQELPKSVFESCRSLMKSLGIVSGGFDFIVDTEGRWFFMEVNEAGQFLFIEAWCQELPILDAFCQFVETASEDFVYDPSLRGFNYIEAHEMAVEAGVVS